MRLSFMIILILCFVQYSIGQDCYSEHKSEYEKVSLDRLTNSRLKKILKPFFMLSDTDYCQQYFINYHAKMVNDSVAYFKIEKGLAKGYEVRIESKKFYPAKHKITRLANGDICLIDNKVFWGTSDDWMPSEKLAKLEVWFNNHKVDIPKSQYDDLYNPSFVYAPGIIHINVKMDKTGEYFVVVLNGSDTSGAYTAVWILNKGNYVGRVVESI